MPIFLALLLYALNKLLNAACPGDSALNLFPAITADVASFLPHPQEDDFPEFSDPDLTSLVVPHLHRQFHTAPLNLCFVSDFPVTTQ